MQTHYKYEESLNAQCIAGIDEAGRGALAGPVVAASVIIPKSKVPLMLPLGIKDSKCLSQQQRIRLFAHIIQHCYYGIGLASIEEIDSLNILNATLLAMHRALDAVHCVTHSYNSQTGSQKCNIPKNELPNEYDVDYVLVDGNINPFHGVYGSQCLVGGDSFCISIAAASIVAKVYRDNLMTELQKKYVQYSFAKHKGYGTKLHFFEIENHGMTAEHRTSFLRKRA